MLDPRILKENPESIRDMLKKRNMTDFPLDDLIILYKRRGELIIKTQELRRKKNLLSETVASKKTSKEDASFELAEKFNQLIMAMPNLLNEGVPVGKDEEENVVVRQNGRIIRPNFSPKDHIDLATSLDLIDLGRAAKVSGSRFYFLKNELVKMNQALADFALDFLSDNNYTLIQPPYMI